MFRGFFLNNLPQTSAPTWWERISRIPGNLQPKQTRFGSLPLTGVWMWSPQLLLLVRFQRKLPWTPSISVLLPSCSLFCSLSCSTCCPSSCFILLSELQPLLVPLQPRRSSSTLPSPLLPGSRKLTDHHLPAGDSNLVFLLDSLSGHRFLVDTEPQSPCSLCLCSGLFNSPYHC